MEATELNVDVIISLSVLEVYLFSSFIYFAADGDSEGTLNNLPYVAPRKHRIEMLASLDQQTICSQRGIKCKEHTAEDNFVDYFCVTHDASVCLLCVKEAHTQCSLITMETKTEENRQTLREQADRLRRQEQLLREVMIYRRASIYIAKHFFKIFVLTYLVCSQLRV